MNGWTFLGYTSGGHIHWTWPAEFPDANRRRESTTHRSTMTTETTTPTEVPPLRDVVTLEGDDLTRAQAWLEDNAVRAVRAAGHCSEALAILNKVFGQPLDTVGVTDTHGVYGSGRRVRVTGPDGKIRYRAYLDSDGVDCWGNEWRDAAGYNRKGLDINGRDKDGFDAEGRDAHGFDRDGNDKDGVHKDAPERFKYDRWGYDKEGFNRLGLDREGKTREVPDTDRFKWDKDGYDVGGINREGYDRRGNYVERRRSTTF